MAFTDADGVPVVPTTVDYRLDDLTNDAEVVAWTPLAAPASSMNFTIPADDNVIGDDSHLSEVRQVVVRVDDGLASEGHEDKVYDLINLQGVP